ncbi:hypothetical protein HYD86_02995 [Mycoplasmopsis bovis]|nr:hypothetical protein [Mycoplasmopsis bovis]QQH36919.1 hypothetical protein HYD86_02995 [Mycoplasmopsis bovis]
MILIWSAYKFLNEPWISRFSIVFSLIRVMGAFIANYVESNQEDFLDSNNG